jgi:hypothetical protein
MRGVVRGQCAWSLAFASILFCIHPKNKHIICDGDWRSMEAGAAVALLHPVSGRWGRAAVVRLLREQVCGINWPGLVLVPAGRLRTLQPQWAVLPAQARCSARPHVKELR